MNGGMSVIGTKQTWQFVRRMYAFGGKADIKIKKPQCPLMTQSGAISHSPRGCDLL